MSLSNIDKRAIFEGMTQTLPVLAFVVDAEGVFREVIANGYTEDLLYEEPQVTIGKSIYELFADEKAEMFAENINRALQTGAVQEFEYSLPIEEKTHIFAGYMAPSDEDTDEDADEDTDEELVIWIVEDITEDRERTLELEQHEVFLESIREEVLVTDTDFTITYESAAVPKLYGYEQGERVGDKILQYVHPDDTEQVRAHFEGQLTESGSTEPIEFRGKTKDGTWTWVESQARVLNDHPTFEGVVITSQDISERVEQRTERQRQHEHLVKAEHLAQMGGWEYIPDTETIRWTDGTRRIFEVSDDFEPTLSEAIEYYHPSDQPRIEEAFEKCLESGVEYSVEAQLITNEGRQRWVHMTGSRDIEDGVTKLIGTIQDITKRKGREQQLEVLNRVLRHNLRNELTTVIGFSELHQDQLPDEVPDYASKIEAAAERLLSLAEKSERFGEAMDYNQITGPIDLSTLLDDLCAEYREKYPEAAIETELRDAQAPGNQMAMKLIFEELLENALKHNDRDHPTVKLIEARPDPDRVMISIVDDGPGIPEMEQQVMQEGEESAVHHSLGIGLWITNWLVNELSGDIRVVSTEGEGAIVTVTLPAVSPE